MVIPPNIFEVIVEYFFSVKYFYLSQVCCWQLVEGGLAAKLDHGPGSGAVHSLAQHPATAQLVTAHQGSISVWQDR